MFVGGILAYANIIHGAYFFFPTRSVGLVGVSTDGGLVGVWDIDPPMTFPSSMVLEHELSTNG